MTHPAARLVRTLVRDVDIADDARLGVALRAGTQVVPATVLGLGAGTIDLLAELTEIPTTACVLTIMVETTVRIDIPVRLDTDGPRIVAHVDGAPLVLRRRMTQNVRLAEILGTAA